MNSETKLNPCRCGDAAVLKPCGPRGARLWTVACESHGRLQRGTLDEAAEAWNLANPIHPVRDESGLVVGSFAWAYWRALEGDVMRRADADRAIAIWVTADGDMMHNGPRLLPADLAGTDWELDDE